MSVLPPKADIALCAELDYVATFSRMTSLSGDVRSLQRTTPAVCKGAVTVLPDEIGFVL